MDTYTFATALGAVGLASMAVLGAGHLGGQGHGGHDAAGHTGGGLLHDVSLHGGLHGDLHGHAAGHASDDAHGPQAPLPAAKAGIRESVGPSLLSLVSPRVLFSVALGFGVTGLLLESVLGGVVLPVAAVVGGIVFEAAIVRPVWNLLFRFASTPASSLEGSLFSEATATSGFDANGEGLVSLEVDGQLVQCLGRLREADRALGIRVRSGDRLRVEDVDPARSQCTVSYVQHGSALS